MKDDATGRVLQQGTHDIANRVSWLRTSPDLNVPIKSVQGEGKKESWRLWHRAESLPGLCERTLDEDLGEMAPVATRGMDIR